MKAKAVTRLARAKINLTLHVTGQREDGYHLLDSLVAFAAVGDVVHAKPATDLSLRVDGPLAKGVPTDERNLVLQAAALFDCPRGAEIHLTKHLPNAAGLGGGSADAAATLLALGELWDEPLPDDLLKLGADVPVCIAPLALRMRGVGEELSIIPPLPDLWAVLVNPGVPLETPPVFKALQQKENPPMGQVPDCTNAAEFAEWCAAQRNDLQAPAIALAPVIKDVLEALEPSLLARMSGSGASCFGLCASAQDAEKLAAKIRAAHPQWWIAATTLS
ncbi:MAG: 4-(cytidine 5'-diphospho)-2-C-methyl-D-erythritol kinase [Planktotalea sp.]|uniref:4-(cytidine 5'-diphospho)-2-C-methyl-D-erythritol kinase n=1 Tax=Planktotalea sp. TaxID=2029877 RepID=UPI003C75828A